MISKILPRKKLSSKSSPISGEYSVLDADYTACLSKPKKHLKHIKEINMKVAKTEFNPSFYSTVQ
jgi:hypothetical protein